MLDGELFRTGSRKPRGRLGNRITELEEELPDNLQKKHISLLYLLGQVKLFGTSRGIPLKEIAQHMELSTSTARSYLRVLEGEHLLFTTSKNPLRFIISKHGSDVLQLS